MAALSFQQRPSHLMAAKLSKLIEEDDLCSKASAAKIKSKAHRLSVEANAKEASNLVTALEQKKIFWRKRLDRIEEAEDSSRRSLSSFDEVFSGKQQQQQRPSSAIMRSVTTIPSSFVDCSTDLVNVFQTKSRPMIVHSSANASTGEKGHLWPRRNGVGSTPPPVRNTASVALAQIQQELQELTNAPVKRKITDPQPLARGTESARKRPSTCSHRANKTSGFGKLSSAGCAHLKKMRGEWKLDRYLSAEKNSTFISQFVGDDSRRGVQEGQSTEEGGEVNMKKIEMQKSNQKSYVARLKGRLAELQREEAAGVRPSSAPVYRKRANNNVGSSVLPLDFQARQAREAAEDCYCQWGRLLRGPFHSMMSKQGSNSEVHSSLLYVADGSRWEEMLQDIVATPEPRSPVSPNGVEGVSIASRQPRGGKSPFDQEITVTVSKGKKRVESMLRTSERLQVYELAAKTIQRAVRGKIFGRNLYHRLRLERAAAARWVEENAAANKIQHAFRNKLMAKRAMTEGGR